jgi:hypothetical protein
LYASKSAYLKRYSEIEIEDERKEDNDWQRDTINAVLHAMKQFSSDTAKDWLFDVLGGIRQQ